MYSFVQIVQHHNSKSACECGLWGAVENATIFGYAQQTMSVTDVERGR